MSLFTVEVCSLLCKARILMSRKAKPLYARTCWTLKAKFNLTVFAVLATISFLIFGAFAIYGSHVGLGTHMWDLMSKTHDMSVLLITTKHQMVALIGCSLSFATGLMLIKLSIICSYLRIFPSRKFQLLLKVVICLVLAMWLTFIFATIFECVPVKAAWDWNIQKSQCIDIMMFNRIWSTLSTCIDFGLWASPFYFFYGMNMNFRKKLGLCLLFGAGLL